MTTIPRIDDLRTKLFADGADLAAMTHLAELPYIRGFTTNPTLMQRAGINDYRTFAHEVLDRAGDRPVSFEVFSDDINEMREQAKDIASWGDNVYVKVPVTNTLAISTGPLIDDLAMSGIKVNVTGVMTPAQVRTVSEHLSADTPAYVSVFAGRIADTGRDPIPIMIECLEVLRDLEHAELIWASPRELLNIMQADAIGCDIITVTTGILAKLPLIGKDLIDYSLETVTSFFQDGQVAGFTL